MNKFLSLSVLVFVGIIYSAQVNVKPTEIHQKIDGFGGGAVYYTNWLTAHPDREAIYDTMFTGLGLSYLRLGNWNQDTTADLAIDSTIVAEGRKRLGDRFKILISSWTAPGYLKVSGQESGSVDGVLLSEEKNTLKKVNGKYVYDQYGHWWKQSIEKYISKGMTPDVISIQNEPDMNASYEGTILKAEETSVLAGYPQALKAVYDSIQTLSYKPEIYGPEVLGIGYNNFQKYADKFDNSLVEGYNYHLYHGTTGPYENPDNFIPILEDLTSKYPNKSWMMSEYCPMRSNYLDSDMLILAQLIHNLLVYGNASSYINWELMWGDGGQMVQVQNPWTTKTYSIAPEYHGMRHFSKFTGPGWFRVEATSDNDDLKTTAFVNPQGDSLTLVAINRSSSEINMSFSAGEYVKVIDAWQSLVSGEKSKQLFIAENSVSISTPAQSITTLVFNLAETTTLSKTPKIKSSNNIHCIGDKIKLRLTQDSQIKIYDLFGKVVYDAYHNEGIVEINNTLPYGHYIINSQGNIFNIQGEK